MDAANVHGVEIVVFDGVDELDALGPYEVLSNAVEAGGDLRVDLVTVDEPTPVTGSHGLVFEPDDRLSAAPDLLVVPGGGWNDRDEAGAYAESEQGDLPAALRERYDRGTTLASVCTGGMVLAAAGLLEGRPATTHAGAATELADYGAERVDARVVDDGDVLTAAGVTSGLDLSLWIVESVCGHDVAEAVATEMEHQRSGDVTGA